MACAFPVVERSGAGAGRPRQRDLLVAKPDLADPNFRETVVLVTQAEDGRTVGVILNRPGAQARADRRDALFRRAGDAPDQVALFRAERAPKAEASASCSTSTSACIREIEPLLAQHAEISACTPDSPAGRRASCGARRTAAAFVCGRARKLAFRKGTAGMWRELWKKPADGPHGPKPPQHHSLYSFHASPAWHRPRGVAALPGRNRVRAERMRP